MGAATPGGDGSAFDNDEPADGAFPVALDPGNDAFLMKHVVARSDRHELLRLEILQAHGAPFAFVVAAASGGLVA